MNRFVLGAVVVLVTAVSAHGIIIMGLPDPFDDRAVVGKAQDTEAVKAAGKQLEAIKQRLLKLKERDFLALLGRPAQRRQGQYAFPIAQPRLLCLSGIRYADEKMNKDHTDFHPIGDIGALEVWYQIDGMSPAAIVFYLRPNAHFPRLTPRNLDQRLAWDRERLGALDDFLQRRWIEVFPWEVNARAEQHFFQGEFSRDLKVKLESWRVVARQEELRLEVDEPATRYRWYRPDGTLAREAYGGTGRPMLDHFIWYDATGRNPVREEWTGADGITAWRWRQPGKTSNDNIRYETANADGRPHSWTWWDRQGKAVRHEWDDNGDGVPDLVGSDKDGRPLRLEESWAVHPRLIPEESRIPDQPQRHVPLRKTARDRK
jgi:hypothetical protein